LFERPTIEGLSGWIGTASNDALKVAEIILQVNEVPEEELGKSLVKATAENLVDQ